MRKARDAERRNFDSMKSWGIRLPKGFVDRRRKVERRHPEVTEGSLDEFQALLESRKENKSGNTEPTDTALDLLTGRL